MVRQHPAHPAEKRSLMGVILLHCGDCDVMQCVHGGTWSMMGFSFPASSASPNLSRNASTSLALKSLDRALSVEPGGETDWQVSHGSQ